MNKNTQNISVDEAKLTLKSLDTIENDMVVSLRPPLWLNAIISLSYGIGVFSWVTTRHDNQWMLGVIVSAFVFSIGVGLYLYRSQLLGVKPKIAPKGKSELIFGFLIAIFFGVMITLSKEFSKDGVWWVSYAGGVMTALALGFLMHRFPSGDYNAGSNQNV